MADRLRPLWDFDDLDATRTRLQGRLAEEEDDAGRAEVLTQLARVEGLRSDFAAGDRLLDQAAGMAPSSAVVEVRVALERGRLRRSAGDPAAALPHFEAAYARAMGGDDGSLSSLAADAAHMAALASGSGPGFEAWTALGLAIAEASDDPGTRYWAGPLLNNLGWEYEEAGRHAEALDAFERALEVRRSIGDARTIRIAAEAVAQALRSLGRDGEAAQVLAEYA